MIKINQQKVADRTKQERIAELSAQLSAIDASSVRPLRAGLAGKATQADTDRLEKLEAEAVLVRAELLKLTKDEP